MLIMAVLVKWLTHRFVDPTHVGSIPTYRLLLLGYGQAVRQQVLILSCAGSNPASPIIYQVSGPTIVGPLFL